MSLFDFISKRGKSTKEYLNIETIKDNYLTTKQGNLFYYFIKPTNISVLSPDALYSRINALMTVLRGQAAIELLCLNSRENFDNNKQHLKERIQLESVPQIVELLKQDLAYYDKIQVQTVTARQFVLIIRILGEVGKETASRLNQIERLIRQHNFHIKLADKDALKQVQAVYWTQNVTSDYFEEYDGERWVILHDEDS